MWYGCFTLKSTRVDGHQQHHGEYAFWRRPRGGVSGKAGRRLARGTDLEDSATVLVSLSQAVVGYWAFPVPAGTWIGEPAVFLAQAYSSAWKTRRQSGQYQ